ncbi:MAG: DUF4334 domain-containing protein, partial [Pseudomonadota bacterium]
DDNRVLGAMDLKGQPLPYFFVLERDDSSEYEVNIFEEAAYRQSAQPAPSAYLLALRC